MGEMATQRVGHGPPEPALFPHGGCHYGSLFLLPAFHRVKGNSQFAGDVHQRLLRPPRVPDPAQVRLEPVQDLLQPLAPLVLLRCHGRFARFRGHPRSRALSKARFPMR